MKIHQAAAALDERLDCGLFVFDRITGIAFLNHNDVGMLEIAAARRMQRAVYNSAVFGEELAPIGQKLRVIMLTGKMRLQTRPDVDTHAIGILARCARSRCGLLGRGSQGKQKYGAEQERRVGAAMAPIC
jgi:hypothetical protein